MENDGQYTINGRVLSEASADEIIAAIHAVSSALASLNEQMVHLVMAMRDLNAGAAQRMAAAACYRAAGRADPAAEPDTF